MFSQPPLGASAPVAPVQPYSFNTQHVWRVRRRVRLMTVATLIVLIAAVVAAYFWWRFTGSPTDIRAMPLLGQLLQAT